jgi:GWxTD domain-containing protein
VKKLLFALAGIVLAANALAEFTKYKDWDKSPEAYFLTPAERTEWKNVTSDEDAEKFILVYYARRGGEAFRVEISRRIAAADQQFKMTRYKRGADSVRGRLLVTLGTPSRASQQAMQAGAPDTAGPEAGTGAGVLGEGSGGEVLSTWVYEKDRFNSAWGLSELRARILVDSRRGSDSLQNNGEVEKVIAVVVEKSVVKPDAVAAAAPAARSAPAAPAPAPAGKEPQPVAPAGSGAGTAAAPASVLTMPLPAAVKSSLEAVSGAGTGEAGFWSGVFRSAGGDPFLALQFYLPSDKAAFSSGAPLKFGGVVTDESDKEVESFWEDATFAEVAEGGRKDRVFDRSVLLPPGSYKGVFGLFASDAQPPVTASSVNFKLTPQSTLFAVSPLILSAGLIPLTKRPGPADPFVFGTEKPFKVEPKGDHSFSRQDSLWYFYGVENPAPPAAAAAAAAPALAATPVPGAADAPAAEAPKPRVQTKINVQRDGKDAFEPFTGPADLVQTSPGIYNSGSEIPLASFEPGYYTFMITVRDLNAVRGSEAHKGYGRKEDFIVLMPDGDLPPKTKPATAPGKPKKP